VATSALLGIVAGVVGGLVVDRSAATHDPLGLGVAQVDQPCTGKTLLVVARGDAAAQLGATIATEGHGVRYLDTRASCDTAWTDPGHTPPRYAAYLGPYDSPAKACPLRMTVAHRGSFVTRLESGTTDPVQCLCYVSFSTMPLLRAGQDISDSTGIYVRAMQRMLTDLGLNPPTHQNGLYDLRTVNQIRQFQHDSAIPVTGATDTQTWQVLVRRGCRLHNS
jgi:peptidoglycan hydrolase-like protein with peptidoglycan-binding domain